MKGPGFWSGDSEGVRTRRHGQIDGKWVRGSEIRLEKETD